MAPDTTHKKMALCARARVSHKNSVSQPWQGAFTLQIIKVVKFFRHQNYKKNLPLEMVLKIQKGNWKCLLINTCVRYFPMESPFLIYHHPICINIWNWLNLKWFIVFFSKICLVMLFKLINIQLFVVIFPLMIRNGQLIKGP